MKVAVIGGGAAGFFAAIAVKENYPEAEVTIFEKTKKLLSKVKVSGGGRCNVTTGVSSRKELLAAYPRGSRQLKKAFSVFDNHDTMKWFTSRGVPLVVEEDLRVFPRSNDSQTIVDCLIGEAKKLKIGIVTGESVKALEKKEKSFQLTFTNQPETSLFDKVIVATGGSPKEEGLEWLKRTGHRVENPVPSLFTFNMPSEPIKKLMGVAVGNAFTAIQGSRLRSEGPLLITHWGMSGPTILKLSAFGARALNEMGYTFKLQVNWACETNQEKVTEVLQQIVDTHPKKHLLNFRPFQLPERLWSYLLEKCQLPADQNWEAMGKKKLNKLINILTNDLYEVKGKTTFKEEFVTCGGVSFESIDINSMQSRVCQGLYFCGEVTDIDGITGGFNFQAAWTTAFIAGKLL